jgi:ubiquinone/menaquinone biosynthesis C-methylase UbiE
MRKELIFRLVAPFGSRLAAQLARPHGWFGRVVMTRALNRGNQELIRATLGLLELSPNSRLLDVGFGGGLSLELAARRGVRHLGGVDPSEAAVERLRTRPSRWLKGVELSVMQGRVEALPFGDAEFAAVLSTNTIYFWPELEPALSELRRVLAPGGQLALGFSTNEKLKSFPAITRHGFVFHAPDDLLARAARVGFGNVRLVELHGGDTEGSYVLLGSV